MATTFIDYTGDGNATKSFSFPSIQESDVKVEVDEVIKSSGTHYNITNYTTTGGGNVVFTSGNIPSSPSAIRIFRDTDVDSAKATYTAGSSVKAADLNDNHEQLLFAAQEEQNQTVITSRIKDAAVTTAKIKPANITTATIADDAVTAAKLADNAIVTANLNANTVTTVKIADSNVTTAKIADSNVTTAKIADSNVTTAKIANNAVTTAKIADGNVTSAKLATGAVTAGKLDQNSVRTVDIIDGNVTSTKLAVGAVVTTRLDNNAVTTAKIADANITAAKIASNAVTTDKIADSELTTLAGMQSTTASNLASSTALTATTAELNQLDGITLETTLTSSDTRIPTSKAVNDQILAVTNALGGFVAIANETSFLTANPDPSNGAGTVVSISQVSSASAVTINNSGVATIANGAGTGNTVTITGFPATLRNTSLAENSGLQVQTTTTLHTYTFHKQLASSADIAAISATVNSFSNRYRVSNTAPTSSLDGGDLWYDTANSKLMVYSSANSAWEESTAIGNFFISTISSSANTGGGSATPNGTAYRFTLSDAPTSAQQLIVSVDGVIQKPNSGSSQPSEGFVLVGNDIIFGAAPANGASIFATVIGSTVGIGTPSNNTVTTAILQNGSVTTAKIVDANVTTAKIADDAVTGGKIADNAVGTPAIAGSAVTEAKIGNFAVTSGKIAADAVTTAKINNTAVTTAKLANGAVDYGKLADDAVLTAKIANGNVTTAKLADDAVTAAKLANTSVTAGSYGSSSAIPVITVDAQGRLTAASTAATSSDLVADTSPQLGGDLDTNSHHILLDDGHAVKFGNDTDLEIQHSGSNAALHNATGHLLIDTTGSFYVRDSSGSNISILATPSGSTQLYRSGTKKFETKDEGTATLGSGNYSTHFMRNGSDVTGGRVQGWANGASREVGFAHPDTQTWFLRCDKNTSSGGTAAIFFTKVYPSANNTYDLGTSTNRWSNIYTNDLNLSNEGSSNDMDGTWGDWTIQEGESDLFLKNNRSGKKYKFNLTEVS